MRSASTRWTRVRSPRADASINLEPLHTRTACRPPNCALGLPLEPRTIDPLRVPSQRVRDGLRSRPRRKVRGSKEHRKGDEPSPVETVLCESADDFLEKTSPWGPFFRNQLVQFRT